MSHSKFPEQYDLFEMKTNATSSDDPNGDYVMAEDVNELQDAIVAIQKSLGIKPQGSYQNISDRLSRMGLTALKVPSVLLYLGEAPKINDSLTTEEAVSYFLKYDHIVFGNNVQQTSHVYHEATKDIMQGVSENKSVSFYGYIDCGVSTANFSISEIQVKIHEWKAMNVKGIFTDNFGYGAGVSRERQNLILDSIHEEGLVAFISATNIDHVFSDTQDTTYNPNWVKPNILEGDIYYYDNFVVNSNIYANAVEIFSNLSKLHDYRENLGIQIFGCATIPNVTLEEDAQQQYMYAHAFSILVSLDGFGANNQDKNRLSTQIRNYNSVALIGQWYSKHPSIQHVNGNTLHKRETAFGSIELDSGTKTYTVSGLIVPSNYILPVANTVEGLFLKDYSVEDSKIRNYNGNRLVTAINHENTNQFINLNRISGLLDQSGGITEGLLQTNILQALNAQIANLEADKATIGQLTAGEITTGKLNAERISASVITAINLYAAEMEVGSAQINTAVIGSLTADHIKASVIEAINIDAQGAYIRNLNADNITAGDISAERIRANVITAVNMYAETMQVSDAKINTAVIGSLTADHIKASVIEAINLSADVAVIDSARIAKLTADHITAIVIEAVNLSATNAKIESAKINNLTADHIQAVVIEAINFSAETAVIEGAKIGNLSADQITSGNIDTDRLVANIIDAVNIKAGIVTSGAAMIDGAAIGTLNASHIQASVISAINMSVESATINAARIGELQAENIAAGAIKADKIDAGAVTAGKIAAGAVVAGNIAADAVVAGNIVADTITTRELAVDAVKAENIEAGSIVAGKIAVDAVVSDNIQANAIKTGHIQAGEIKAGNIDAGAITAGKIAADAITADLIKASVIQAINLSVEFINGNRILARSIEADRIKAGSITAAEIAAGAITANQISANSVTADKIFSGSISSDHISTGGLDANIVNVYNGTTGETLIGGGFLRVDGLDVGVVQSDNLVLNGLFLTSSSGYGLWRQNEAGAVILGSQTTAIGGHEVWKIDTQTGSILNRIPIPGKKPVDIAFDAIEQYAYVTVQGNNQIVQIDMDNAIITDKFLPSTGTPGKIGYTGDTMEDHKHFLILGRDPDDAEVPDYLMVVDSGPTSINSAMYMHHVIPLGNSPYDLVMDDDHNIYITMHDEGDIVRFSAHGLNSLLWKVTGRIPISAYMTDNYHGGLPGEVGFNYTTGGSPSVAYQKDMGAGGGHAHAHGGYGASDGSIKEYKPKGIALSSDSDILYVSDHANNQLVVVSKAGRAYYNPLTGTRERGNLGHWGQPSPLIEASQGGSNLEGGGGGGDHGGHSVQVETQSSAYRAVSKPVLGPAPVPPMFMEDSTPITTQLRDYTNTNGETNYVHYRIDIGDSPDKVVVHNGKIYVTCEGSNAVVIVNEQQILDKLAEDRDYYYNEFADWPSLPSFAVKSVSVGSKPGDMILDKTGNKIYISLTAQNQIAVFDIATETVERLINVGANPAGLKLTQDGTTLYVVNHGGSGNLSFVYKEGPYIGDAYIGLEGQVSYHGAHGWMPNRSNWTYKPDGNVKSSAIVEFRINEPFLNEGGYVRLAAQGMDHQWATIEQDIINVTNYSDGTNPKGTWFKYHNGSALLAMASGNSQNFLTQFEVEEFVPKYVVYDNQQTTSFTPIEDGINQTYDGLEYSIITNRAKGKSVTSSRPPVSGSLSVIVDDLEPADEHQHAHGMSLMHSFGESVKLPSGLQSVTIDLGEVYMVPKIVVMHEFHQDKIYHKTKTEVSVDGVKWTTVYDSSVSGEYPEYTSMPMDGGNHIFYGKHIEFPAIPVRYVRDWANGWSSIDGKRKGTDNNWTEIKVYGDWQVIYGEVYPNNTDKAGEPIATNGTSYVSTNVQGAWIAHDIAIEFSSWSWMTFIAGPDHGVLSVEMPSLMASDHFVDQNWSYKTNIPHQHTMILSPSVDVLEDEMKNIKAGKHRLVFKQVSGTVTIDRLRYEDYQYYTKSSTLIPNNIGTTFRRFKIIAEQAKGYLGKGRQTTEGAYDQVRVSPDSGLPDQSVPIKYRFRIKAELNADGIEEDRGTVYVTSCLMETGKLSSHWRMSQSGDLFPGTRVEAWDSTQPHKTGIQNHHLANGSVRGPKIMPNALMNYHVSPYARISEYKLDLNYKTHGHGKYVAVAPGITKWVDNKDFLDSLDGFPGTGDYYGTSNAVARADHSHPEIEQASHSHNNMALLNLLTGTSTSPINLDHLHRHTNKTVLDLFTAVDGVLLWNGSTIDSGSEGGALYSGAVHTKHIMPITGIAIETEGYGIVTSQIRDAQVTNLKLATGIDGAKLLNTSVINISSGRIIAGAGSILGGNTTITGDGTLYVGSSSNDNQDGELVVRSGTGAMVIHLDGDSSGKIDNLNIKSYIAGNGNADFAGTVKMNTLQVVNTGVVPGLNSEKVGSVAEPDLAKNASIKDLTGFGVDRGVEVTAETIPNMTVKITEGAVYTSSGRRIYFNGTTTLPLQQASKNYDRYDVVFVRGASAGAQEGQVMVQAGTASATPIEPTIPADGIKLAVVHVRQNVGTITDGTSGSYSAIRDVRKYREVRFTEEKFQVEGMLKLTKGATKVVIPAGETSVTWTHHYGSVSYAVTQMASSSARHVFYKNLTATSIDLCVDDPYENDIEVLLILVGY